MILFKKYGKGKKKRKKKEEEKNQFFWDKRKEPIFSVSVVNTNK
jgi:hypothetical protein